MERDGLVLRLKPVNDQRKLYVSLTKEGNALYEHAQAHGLTCFLFLQTDTEFSAWKGKTLRKSSFNLWFLLFVTLCVMAVSQRDKLLKQRRQLFHLLRRIFRLYLLVRLFHLRLSVLVFPFPGRKFCICLKEEKTC